MAKSVRTRRLLIVVAIVVAVPVAWAVVRHREFSRRLACGANMKNFAMAVVIYGGGPSPSENINALIHVGLLQHTQSVCPNTGSAYRFNAACLTSRLDSLHTTIVAYEDPANHGGVGGNVVYGDTHATFESASDLARLLAEQGLAK